MYSTQPIHSLSLDDLKEIVPGYSSSSVYEIRSSFTDTETRFSLNHRALDRPFEKMHDYSDHSSLAHYNEVIRQGYSYGAFAEKKLVGFILAERQIWNSTLVIREFGVTPKMRRHGIGKELLEKAIDQARQLGLRGILCETQSTNVPAIRLYQKLGFSIQGLDLALYSNEDAETGEVAVFLRKAVPFISRVEVAPEI